MNLYIGVGVMVGDPYILRRTQEGNHIAFKIATVDEITGKDVYINCLATGTLGHTILTKCKDGNPVVVKGHLGFNRQKNTNYVEATYMQLLFDAMSKPVKMGLKEFLEIYSPQSILNNLNALEKEQRKAQKQKEEEQCSDMQSLSDTSNPKQ